MNTAAPSVNQRTNGKTTEPVNYFVADPLIEDSAITVTNIRIARNISSTDMLKCGWGIQKHFHKSTTWPIKLPHSNVSVFAHGGENWRGQKRVSWREGAT